MVSGLENDRMRGYCSNVVGDNYKEKSFFNVLKRIQHGSKSERYIRFIINQHA